MTKTERRSLRVDLNNDERIRMGSELAQAIQSQEDAENEKTEVAAQFKADIERHRTNAARIAKVLANGYEYREVECTVRPLPPVKGAEPQMEVVRNDTGDQVLVRAMTEQERQAALPLPGEEIAAGHEGDGDYDPGPEPVEAADTQ